MNSRCTLTGVLLLWATARLCSAPLNEQEILIRGLRTNTRTRLFHIEEHFDSLDLALVRSGQLPAVDLELGTSIERKDNRVGVKDSSRLHTSGSAGIKQVLPGGGTLSTSIGKSTTTLPGFDSLRHGTQLSVGLSQPLLRGAWSDAPLERAIRIRILDNKSSAQKRKKDLAQILSDLRSRYWTLYQSHQLLAIRENEVALQQRQLEFERRRFSLGATAEIDTLTSALELLRSRQSLFTARKNTAIALRNLALQMGMDSTPDISLDVQVELGDLAPVTELINRIESFDPQAEIFSLLQEKLHIQLRNAQAGLLPDLTLGARYSRAATGPEFLPEFQSFSGNSVISLVLGYSLPATAKKSGVVKIRHSVTRTEIEEQEHRRTLSKRIDELVLSWDLERSNLEVMETARLVAEKRLRAAESGYAAGTVDQLSLIKAHNDFTDISVQLVRAKVSLKLLEIIFDELTGAVFTKFGMDIQ